MVPRNYCNMFPTLIHGNVQMTAGEVLTVLQRHDAASERPRRRAELAYTFFELIERCRGHDAFQLTAYTKRIASIDQATFGVERQVNHGFERG